MRPSSLGRKRKNSFPRFRPLSPYLIHHTVTFHPSCSIPPSLLQAACSAPFPFRLLDVVAIRPLCINTCFLPPEKRPGSRETFVVSVCDCERDMKISREVAVEGVEMAARDFAGLQLLCFPAPPISSAIGRSPRDSKNVSCSNVPDDIRLWSINVAAHDSSPT